MREIIFRRCRLEIEPSGLVRVLYFCLDELGRYMPPPPGTPECISHVDATFTVDISIAHAFLCDVLDEPGATDEDIAALLDGTPIAAFGLWDTMAQIWFDRLRRGWKLLPHGEPLVATTVTSFLASAIKAKENADHPNEHNDAREHAQHVGGDDGLDVQRP